MKPFECVSEYNIHFTQLSLDSFHCHWMFFTTKKYDIGILFITAIINDRLNKFERQVRQKKSKLLTVIKKSEVVHDTRKYVHATFIFGPL